MNRSNEEVLGSIHSMSRAFNNGWRVLSVVSGLEEVKMTGCLPATFQTGDHCRFVGKWVEHQKFGRQFQFDNAIMETPKDKAGLQVYLADNFPFIGPAIAKRLVATYGEHLFKVIETDPEPLLDIQGITPERLQDIITKHEQICDDREIDVFFATHGISANMQIRLMDAYHTKRGAYKAVKKDPYKLIEAVDGIGFVKADTMAMSMGIMTDDPHRIRAGVIFCLLEATKSGHVYLPKTKLLKKAAKLLGVQQHLVSNGIDSLSEKGRVIIEGDKVFHCKYHAEQEQVAENLKRLLDTPTDNILRNLTEKDLEQMDPDQQAAVEAALNSRVSVITGGPGVGKTFTINQILKAVGSETKVALAAPTGKAAKRMEEATGEPAQTIHRLLEYMPGGGFRRNNREPLECDVLIVDETSMVDISLMASLMDAIDPNQTRIIFVGDVDQLPSVGPGAVLKDMIQSGVVPTSWLRHIHRTGKDSLIPKNAQHINHGEPLELEKGNPDVQVYYEADKNEIPNIILRACRNIPKKFGYKPSDIQVLAPQKKGPVGTFYLNKLLQPFFNPNFKKQDVIGTTGIRIGDRVIQMRNNYGIEVFNGDVGTVMESDGTLTNVNFGGREVLYESSDLIDLHLAYALTIHKSQGSEFPVVVIPMHSTNHIMLKRNLLYTGLTRAKNMVMLIGTSKAIHTAINTVDASVRHTSLSELLKEK